MAMPAQKSDNSNSEILRPPSLAVVIPAFNAAKTLPRTLECLNATDGFNLDIVVSDGESMDASVDVAARMDARVTSASGGRGAQLARGAETALGEWLLFLHADTILSAGWVEETTEFIRDPKNRRRAGYFRFMLDDSGRSARRLERMVALRCRLFGLPYGDQGLLISRAFYEELGGYPNVPLMEDVMLNRRIGRFRLVQMECSAITSAVRFRNDGYLRRSLRNLFCLTLYFIGVPPRAIGKIYGR